MVFSLYLLCLCGVSAVSLLWLPMSIYFQFYCVIPAHGSDHTTVSHCPSLLHLPCSALCIKGTDPSRLYFPGYHISWLLVSPNESDIGDRLKGSNEEKGRVFLPFFWFEQCISSMVLAPMDKPMILLSIRWPLSLNSDHTSSFTPSEEGWCWHPAVTNLWVTFLSCLASQPIHYVTYFLSALNYLL